MSDRWSCGTLLQAFLFKLYGKGGFSSRRCGAVTMSLQWNGSHTSVKSRSPRSGMSIASSSIIPQTQVLGAHSMCQVTGIRQGRPDECSA